MTNTKRLTINIKATIEVGEDFNVDNIVLCKLETDSYTGCEMFLPKTKDFKVIDYLDVVAINTEEVERGQ